MNTSSPTHAVVKRARNVSAKRPSDFFFRVYVVLVSVLFGSIGSGNDESLHLAGRTSLLSMGALYRGGVVIHVNGMLVLS
jgi:hypothetical protein